MDLELAELLAKISPEEATTPPTPGAHSISELLQHLLLWNERVRNTSESSPMPKWEAEKEWAEPPIPWNELVGRWNKSRDLLEERLRNFPIEDLGKQVPGRTCPLRNAASRNRATHDLPLRTDCDGLEHAQVAFSVALVALVEAPLQTAWAKEPIEEGEDNVEALVGGGVMLEVVAPGGFEPGGQPAAKVNAPVDFFVGHEINDEANHHAARQPGAKHVLDSKDRHGVHGKQQHNDQRVFGQIHVERLIGRAPGGVMQPVVVSQRASRGVQQEAVKEILEGIGVEKPEKDAGEKTHRFEGEFFQQKHDKQSAEEDRGDSVPSLGSQAYCESGRRNVGGREH